MPVMVESSIVVVAFKDTVDVMVELAMSVVLGKPPHPGPVGEAVTEAVSGGVGKLHEQKVEATEKGPWERLLRRLEAVC